jgi:hypothetical protein
MVGEVATIGVGVMVLVGIGVQSVFPVGPLYKVEEYTIGNKILITTTKTNMIKATTIKLFN